MKISAVAAQFPVSLDVGHNLAQIQAILASCQPSDLVVLPEGALSGYSDDIGFLQQIDLRHVEAGLDQLQSDATRRGLHVFCGVCRKDGGHWRNQAVYFSPEGDRWSYSKVNLATHERGHVEPGNRLMVMPLRFGAETVGVGVQLCREIRYPEQWQALARAGADVLVYMTHGIDDSLHCPVWRSHLISRAAETQRWVVASNTAHPEQLSPTLIVDPRGLVRVEVVGDEAATIRYEVDTDAVSNWYLSQARVGVAVAQVDPRGE